MYKLKPIFKMPIEIKSTCQMYKLKNIHKEAIQVFNKSDKVEFNCDLVQLSDHELGVLLEEQININNVFETLKELKERLTKLDVPFLNGEQSVSISEKQPTKPTSRDIASEKYEEHIVNDIEKLTKEITVIFADPEDPPYSLLTLPILWPGVSWNISYHIHSSITKDIKELKDINAFKNILCHGNNKTVRVVVIWQPTNPSPKIVRSPTDVIFGEVALLYLFNQYLAVTKTIVDFNENDLDLIYEINCSKNDRTSELYNLISDSDTKLNIKNIAIWSLLYKKNKNPSNIEKWIEHFKNIVIP